MHMEIDAEQKLDLFKNLAVAIVEMDEIGAALNTQKLIDCQASPQDILDYGLIKGMTKASELFEREEYFITEILLCADAMEAGLSVLRPCFEQDEMPSKGRIVIGTTEGDTHDIGKNIVALVLKGAGFSVLDVGRDVTPRAFVDAALKFDADIIAVSALMTTTMENIEGIIQLLEQEGLRDRFRVICGGKPLSAGFAKRIGADGYSASANGAVKLAQRIMKEKAMKAANKNNRCSGQDK